MKLKQFAFMAGIVMGLALGAREARAATTNSALTVRFSFTAYMGKPWLTVTNGSTTNTVAGIATTKFSTPDFLNILATEFNTNFPTGAQLGMDINFRFVVLDKGGNVILQASSNPLDSSYVFSVTNNADGIYSGKSSQTPRTQTEVLKMLQPDFGIYYADGHGNKFHFSGLAFINGNGAVINHYTLFKTVSLLVPGCSGGGTFYNRQDGQYDDAVFTGMFGASGANLPENND